MWKYVTALSLLLILPGCSRPDGETQSNEDFPVSVEKKIEDETKYLRRLDFFVRGFQQNSPIFRITINPDNSVNTVIFETEKSGLKKTLQYPLGKEKIRELAVEIDRANFDRFEDDYTVENNCFKPASELRYAQISIDYKYDKTVRHCLDEKYSGDPPPELIRFEKHLEETVKLKGVIFDSQPAAVKDTALNKNFKIVTGEEFRIKNHDLYIRFVSILRDNRCPPDVTCSTRGEAIALMMIRKGDQKELLVLSDGERPRSSSESFLKYRIHLLEIPRENYEPVTLKVTDK